MQAYYQLSYVDRRVTDPEQIICDDAQRLAAELAKTTGDIASAAVDGAFYTVRPWPHNRWARSGLFWMVRARASKCKWCAHPGCC